jgi:hypothetical protein
MLVFILIEVDFWLGTCFTFKGKRRESDPHFKKNKGLNMISVHAIMLYFDFNPCKSQKI